MKKEDTGVGRTGHGVGQTWVLSPAVPLLAECREQVTSLSEPQFPRG